MFFSRISNFFYLLVIALVGCSAPTAGGVSVCSPQPKNLVDVSTADTGSELDLADTVAGTSLGKQFLYGYFDAEWNFEGETGHKRCVMSLQPREDDSTDIKIITASHCLPSLPDSEDAKFKFTVYIQDGKSFFPLSVASLTFKKSVVLSYLMNKHVLSKEPNGNLGQWVPESGTQLCKQETIKFKTQSQPGTKTACFSLQDTIKIDARVTERNEKRLKRYNDAVVKLNRIKGAAYAYLPDALRADYPTFMEVTSISKTKNRNLRSIAYLSNNRFCALAENTQNIDPDDLDSRVFCNMTPELREAFFQSTAFDEEYPVLLGIRTDMTTPLVQLRDKHRSCLKSPFSGSEDETRCMIERKARELFGKWVFQGEQQFNMFTEAEKRGLQFSDYFTITTEVVLKTNRAIEALNLAGRFVPNNSIADQTKGVFLFDYAPSESAFSFEKGDSGSLLNIFGGYPVGVLSTVDGEPTSGGATITALPEAEEEAMSPGNASCR